MKRFLDLLLSIFALIVLSPLLIPVMLILRFSGENCVFYRQERIGRRGSVFGILKFVTMLKESANLGSGDITIKNDPRVLPFGHFLRKSKINELPQLINIVLGEMSIVGPRPLTPKNFNFYSDDIKHAICNLAPGLSGIGSVIFRDEESILANSGLDYEECYRTRVAPYKGALEDWYANHYSLLVDAQIIFLTLWVIFFSRSELPYRLFRDLPKKPSWLE